MKSVILALLVGITPGLVSADPLSQGLILGRPAKQKSALEVERERMADKRTVEQQRQAALNNAANYRMVDGKLYNAELAADWVTIPGPYQQGKFSRSSAAGPVFTIEKRMSVSYGSSLSDGGRVWYEFDREIVVKHYPLATKVAGEKMLSLRVLPIKTGTDGITIYDYGTPPPPKPATNSPSAAASTNLTKQVSKAVK